MKQKKKRTLEDLKQELKSLPEPLKNAVAAMTDAFEVAKELKQNFGLFILVVGHENMEQKRPVHFISNMTDNEANATMLEYSAKRIREKLEKERIKNIYV